MTTPLEAEVPLMVILVKQRDVFLENVRLRVLKVWAKTAVRTTRHGEYSANEMVPLEK